MTNRRWPSLVLLSLFTVASGIFVGCEGRAEPDFSLDLSLQFSEESKDSNTESYSIDIEGRNVSYAHWWHGGLPGGIPEPIEKEFRLNDEQYEEMVTLIREHWLNRSLKEEQAAGLGGRELVLSLAIELGGQSTESTVSGMQSVWGQGGETNISNTEYLESVRDLIELLEGAGKVEN